MNTTTYDSIPGPWRGLVTELNGGRPPDGEPGVRDVDAPCEAFKPYGAPFEDTQSFGSCMTDGHYMCCECTEIDQHVFWRKRDRCDECGAPIVDAGTINETCTAGCWQVTP